MAYPKFTVLQPTPNTSEAHIQRLVDLDLRWGATSVYRDRTGIYWTPVEKHIPPAFGYTQADIEHNTKRMVTIMEAEGLTYMGKAYDSDIYKSKQRIDLSRIDTFEGICNMNHTNRLVAINPPLPIEVSHE